MTRALLFLLPVLVCSRPALGAPMFTTELGEFSAEGLAGPTLAIEAAYEEGQRDLWVKITSPGGSIFAGWAFIREVGGLERKGLRLHCVVDGYAASMAAVTLETVCSERLITDRSWLLFHEGSTKTEGTEQQIASDLALLHAININVAATVSRRLKMSVVEYVAHVHGQDWVLDPWAAVKAGAADRVITPEEMPEG